MSKDEFEQAPAGVSITVQSDEKGHWVLWHKGETSGILGPYSEERMAIDVRSAKLRELTENEGSIDDASPFRRR